MCLLCLLYRSEVTSQFDHTRVCLCVVCVCCVCVVCVLCVCCVCVVCVLCVCCVCVVCVCCVCVVCVLCVCVVCVLCVCCVCAFISSVFSRIFLSRHVHSSATSCSHCKHSSSHLALSSAISFSRYTCSSHLTLLCSISFSRFYRTSISYVAFPAAHSPPFHLHEMIDRNGLMVTTHLMTCEPSVVLHTLSHIRDG